MRYSPKMREEELKNKVARDFFGKFDCTETNNNIDFIVRLEQAKNSIDLQNDYLLWAEAKKATEAIDIMLAQLILTIGKARVYNRIQAPAFLGCFDCEKIAFIEYYHIQDIFTTLDFNWNVTPSKHTTREFKLLRDRINKLDANQKFIFDFDKDEKSLKTFIKSNFDLNLHPVQKILIDKKNFMHVFHKWLDKVKPSIGGVNWAEAKKFGLLEGDFYLADLLSLENKTIRQKLHVLLDNDHYIADRHFDKKGMLAFNTADFKDGQKAHTAFWAIYERPPKKEYWDYMVNRHDLLVPQDIRERQGSFFTPQIWVELSQKYIADVFGENWQEEYYVWDCAAGTGNLLAGLTNKRNIWASTLNKADVDIMHDRIDNGANLLKEHCFQFDFLNDDFDKLPQALQKIIKNTPEKLIVYINPPYAEIAGNKIGVNLTKIHDLYHTKLSDANRELFAQFLIRIFCEIPNCQIANFSTLKSLSSAHFKQFRNNFQARLEKLFVCPANTFDNVKGLFPIGFFIWNTNVKKRFNKIVADVFGHYGNYIGKKKFYSHEKSIYFSAWVNSFKSNTGSSLGWLEGITRNDFQSQHGITILNKREQIVVPRGMVVCVNNLTECCICYAVRHCIEATWLNDRDQFLYPNDGWQTDNEFQSDCLAFALFHSGNNISSKHGVNHWIPFTEDEVNASDSFESHFMVSFMTGKIIQNGYSNLFEQVEDRPCIERAFSAEAKAVFDAGRELWKYYHEQPKRNVNASFYDIREHFQGRNAAGRMNSKSEDEKYTEFIDNLRIEIKVLAKKIEPSVYEYGFLRD